MMPLTVSGFTIFRRMASCSRTTAITGPRCMISLVAGNYALNITGKDGKTYQKIFQFNGQVDLPPMSNNHFKYEASENGGPDLDMG